MRRSRSSSANRLIGSGDTLSVQFLEAALPDPNEILASGGGEAVHLRFLECARANPDGAAVAFEGGEWSYGELDRRSRALAIGLQAAGARRGAVVAIVAERGPEVVCAMLATARLGGTFVVLDVGYPQARLEVLTQIAMPGYIVAAGDTWDAASALSAASGAPLVDANGAMAGKREPIEPLDEARPDDIAYYLFTSGTTGLPKCIACTHRPLSHFVRWQEATFELTAADRFTMLSGLSHDPVLRDVFTPLSIGARLNIPRQETITAPGALVRWFQKADPTVCHLTPAMGQLLTAGAPSGLTLPHVRHFFWGGDRLTRARIDDVARLAPRARHANFYGSTETPQAAGYFCDRGVDHGALLPVGQGIADFQLLIVDEARRPIEDGEEGEVAVRSNYLSCGYVRDGRLDTPGDRGVDRHGCANIYYTGDRGRRLADGSIMVLGRADDQVKVRGYRVDLSEITAALLADTRVASAAVIAVGDGPSLRIVAFVAPAPDQAPANEAELLAALGQQAPSYMLPNELIVREALPLLPNGKVDRQQLRDLAASPAPAIEVQNAADLGEGERAIMECWRPFFPRSHFSPATSFAQLGGDSLAYVQAYLATEQVLGEVPAGWTDMSIAELAALRKPVDRIWTVIDTPMLVRAAAITLVVGGHLMLVPALEGPTTALFMVSGFLFGGLQLRESLRTGKSAGIVKSMFNIALPTLLYAIVSFIQLTIRDKDTSPAMLFMVNEFVDYKARPAGATTHDYRLHLWYVHALLKILLLLAILMPILKLVKPLRDPLVFAATLFFVGCAARFALPAALDAGLVGGVTVPASVIAFSPTTHFATFMLGALIANTKPAPGKGALLIGIVLYAALTYWVFEPESATASLVAGVVLLAASRVVVPRPVASLTMTLAGASLFIYLTHHEFGSATRRLLGVNLPLVELVVAILAGVLCWRLWTWATAAIAKQWRTRKDLQPA